MVVPAAATSCLTATEDRQGWLDRLDGCSLVAVPPQDRAWHRLSANCLLLQLLHVLHQQCHPLVRRIRVILRALLRTPVRRLR